MDSALEAASIFTGVLWQGGGGDSGFDPAAPVDFAASMAFLAAILFLAIVPAEPSAGFETLPLSEAQPAGRSVVEGERS